MKYKEPRDRSAEVLRAALAQMAQHDAALNPHTFAVWYEHLAGINQRLSRAIEERLRSEPRLGDEAVARLYADYVAEVDEGTIQRARGQLEGVMSGISARAERTGAEAGRFGETLGGLEAALRDTGLAELAPEVARVRETTADMKASAEALSREVEVGRREIERLRQDLIRARDETLVDALTRVLNRKGFDQKLAEMLAQPAAPDTAHALVIVDIDRFKSVNDQYGHMMGDRVLQAVGEVLRSTTVDPGQSVARYGGEEFAILLPQSPPGSAHRLAERCRERVRALHVRDRRTKDVILTVTVSAGVASLKPGEEATGLIERADRALYAAKDAGRDRVVVAD